MAHASEHPVILTYHSIAEGPSALEIPPRVFAAQMEWLAAKARVAPLQEIVEALKIGRPQAEYTVVLTFDDGYADFYEYAAPVLMRLKFPATVFLPTGFVGKTNHWPNAHMAEKPLMSWEQIRQLAGQGIELGSHSHTHPVLTDPGAKLDEELKHSSGMIEERIGRKPAAFCYPYGRWDSKAREAVKSVYSSGCTTGAGVVEPESDPYALPRVDAHYVRDMSRFRSLFSQRFELYLEARRWIRRLRGAPEGHVARLDPMKPAVLRGEGRPP
jgi:peptidoglycan/xylan/chitin deacetylase (PgdA/CDA1 family)